ncbi:MAG: PadR family transcriptional regulator [Bacteroidetes bacterium]|nr:PadR family transcriptional regulator [Bacteroidota bacterium]MCB0846308.1 PadR family transcriptional regulator [Bacteroidota bacterium]MCB0852309.1 PadR family transcriptional regulator [Bacteroidota bacterium]
MIPNLGSLEETILLIVLVMEDEAYGFSISEVYNEKIGKTISIPAIHTVLKRLEKKGFVKSSMGGATQERGGRKKRIYEVTSYGYRALCDLRDTRDKLWENAPNWSLN